MKESKDVIKDPVCGMSVNTAFAISAERDGKTYYFCGDSCRQRFLAAPALKQEKEKNKSHGDCCGLK